VCVSYKKYRVEGLKNPAIKAEFDAHRVEFQVASQLIEARLKAKMTQQEVAEKMKTTQSVIARLESGEKLPSLSTILRYVEAVNRKIILEILPSAC
jgi:ribosome-binding protein aMBF1 (putative translation factor)